MSHEGTDIKKLQEQIKVLEQENNLLAERIEESMLIGLVAENFETINNRDELIESVLEKISILKSIPFCACYHIQDGNAINIGTYCLLQIKDSCDYQVSFAPQLLHMLAEKATLRINFKETTHLIKLKGQKVNFTPLEAVLIPYENRSIELGFFMFITNEQSQSFGADLSSLQHLINLLNYKWERISLLKELRLLNMELEGRVKLRTNALIESIKKLKEETQIHASTAKKLRFSEEKYKQLFNMANDAIFLWRVDKNLLELSDCIQSNSSATCLSGYTQMELKSLKFSTLLRINKYLSEDQLIQTIIEHGSFSFESTLTGKHQLEIPVEVSACFFNMNGEPVILAICRDITDRKESEKALIEARNRAIESEKLKSAFLANMSHEIRTPMNAIVGFSEILKNGNVSTEETLMYSEIIFKNSLHLLNLINDIVDFSKIEANQMNIVNELFNINELISELSINTITMLHNLSKGDINVNVYTPLDDDKAIILVDGTRLRQILINLINNAIKFTFKGSIDVGYELPKGNQIKFFVKDSGIGISLENQSKVFERFVQIKNEKNRNTGGTGLGLSICAQLLDKMNGSIGLESHEEVGTTFHFTIPYQLAK